MNGIFPLSIHIIPHLCSEAVTNINMDTRSLIISLAAAAVLLLAWRVSRIGRRPAGLPPGPPTLPILGNIHLMPKRDAHLQFEKWAQEYGPVYSLILGTKTMIVLSSDVAVKDLLDKRSAIYSARQDMYIGMTLCSDNLRFLMMVRYLVWTCG